MKKKDLEGTVIFLEDDLDILHPWLYQQRFRCYKLKCNDNLEQFDNERVKVNGILHEKKGSIEVASIERT